MSAEERIARLTELARQVWPHLADELVVGVEDGIDVSAEDPIAYVDATHVRMFFVEHRRSLDALEATLLALAGKPSFEELLSQSSVGEGLRALREDPEAELARLEEELTPEVMDQLRRWNEEPADEVAPYPEIVICSAIRLRDGRIFRGHRHHDCMRTAEALVEHQEPGSWMAKHGLDLEQGFITSRNRYVDREEGLRLQKAAGIESACKSGYRNRSLFSEDLY